MRIKFEKGKQRKFIQDVLKSIGGPSLYELINRGVNISYSSLKNYYSERRLLPEELFDILCGLSRLNKDNISFKKIPENWGQSKGGFISKK